MEALSYIAYTLAVAVVLAFGLSACAYAAYREMLQGGPDSPDFFLTARRSVKTFMVAWSFFASAMGSWALFGPPSYCLTAGATGTLVYSLFSGLPVLLVAWLGSVVHRLVPDVVSMADYVRRRFGLLFSLYISLLMVLNMAIAMTAEYTAVGDLFQHVLGAPRVPIVLLLGATAMLYTAAGGLYVSIVTDQWQALASIIFTALLTTLVLATFPSPLPPLSPNLGWSNPLGLASLVFMPVSLLATTLFNEAMWQRCWASASPSSLLWGAALGSAAITAVVSLLGFAGLLAAWSGVYQPSGPDDSGNTILFSLFRHQKWALVTVTLLSVTMSESAVDSLQNAMVDTIASDIAGVLAALRCRERRSRLRGKGGGGGAVPSVQPKGVRCADSALSQSEVPGSLKAGSESAEPSPPVAVTTIPPSPVSAIPEPDSTPPHHPSGLSISSIRALVLILNVPPLLASLQGFNVLQLFLLINLINTTSFLPLLLGILQGPLSHVCVTPSSSVAGCCSGLLSLVVWAKTQQIPGESYVDALSRTFLDAYDYPPFLLALGFSAVGMTVGAGVEAVVRYCWRIEYSPYVLDYGKGRDLEESRNLLG
ncbi:hypothetical protein CLOP_g8651 [Closterium sp. NIES-67]|nr:hypothetical protein CLOP_g8651 [Closterium sp. NIES-67]